MLDHRRWSGQVCRTSLLDGGQFLRMHPCTPVRALGLLAVAWATTRWPGTATSAAGWLFLAGILLFSGSLYGLSLSGLRSLGAITPIGGVAWIVGWLVLGWGVWQGR
ncbi:MAG: DUF423 domain-containing protein [candidate division NC10 bacterium]